MNPADPRHPWQRLAAAARRAPDGADTAAPYGFATRVTARAFAAERAPVSLFERFALRAVGVACLLALASVLANYSVLTFKATATAEDEMSAGDDPVAVLLDT